MISFAVSENKKVLLSGDLNCNYLASKDHKELKDIVKINGLQQLIDKPTRISKGTKTIIDIIATSDT